MNRFLLPLSLFLLCLVACKTKQNTTRAIEISKIHKLVLADSLAATNFITSDVHDDFFTKITDADLSVQMKKGFDPSEPHRERLAQYLLFLQKDVRNFKQEEALFVEKCIRNAYKMCSMVSSDLFPKELKIIKIKGKPYGNGTYYTREDCIIVPANELEMPDEAKFTETMLHELFHIYSRFHAEQRLQLYDLVGFHPLENQDLQIPKQLESRILLNPDGTNFAYYIDIQLAPDKTIKAIPILYTPSNGYQKNKGDFFGHLKFSLFQVEQSGHGYAVVCKDDASSTIDMKNIPDFYRQIRDNTDYIIHPDEILADNFMYTIQLANGKDPKKFSTEGRQLLNKIKTTFK
jgi:hypothetical protein